MKHYKRFTGFSQIKKTPTRRLRKAMENFFRLYSSESRAQAKQQLAAKLYANSSIWIYCSKGRQGTVRVGTEAREDMLPNILANDFVIARCHNGRFKVISTVRSRG